MFFGGVGGFEAEFCRNFGAGGRRPCAGDGALDKIEDLLLAVGELGATEHVDSFKRLGKNVTWEKLRGVIKFTSLFSCPVTVFLISFRKFASVI